jgi:ribosomal-protein-alanine N-acetyltransferase
VSGPTAEDRVPSERGPAAVRIRPARPRDLPAVTAIECTSFGDPWSPAAFAPLVENPAVYFVVAECDGVVAGYLVTWFAADEGEIGNVAVAPAARGRGVGRVLVDAGLAEAARRGAATVYLEVRESNAVARRLYAGCGFAEVGRRRRYYQHPVEDALVLARPIAAAAAARGASAHRA